MPAATWRGPQEEVAEARFDFVRVIPEIRAALRALGLDADRMPLIAAGGVNSPERVAAALAAGADAVQVGTAFAVTEECDAHPNFKRVLAEAKPRGHRGVHERRRAAGARGAHALARQLSGQARGAQAARARAQLHARLAVPGAMRSARRHSGHGPVLHRPPPRSGAARRRRSRPFLPRLRERALRQPQSGRCAIWSTCCSGARA